MHVDDVLFDAAFRPKTITLFVRVPLGRERTGGMCLRCSFPGIGLLTTHVLALPSSFPGPSPNFALAAAIELLAIRSLSPGAF